MSTGKKGKKSKEKKLSLQDFLATSTAPTPPVGSTQVSVQKYSSWADECDEDDDQRSSRTEIIQLPTAPRAARILDDDSIPHTGPFIAHISNLPFDSSEPDIDEFFEDHDIHVKEMRLARDDSNDRLRGHGFVEFETREDLINAVMMTDTNIRNRRIRIAVSSEADQRDSSGRTLRKRYDNYTARDPTTNESTNWRDRKESTFEPAERENRRSYQQRSNFQNRHDSNNNDDGAGNGGSGGGGGNWRTNDRPMSDSPPPERRRQGGFGGGGDRRGGNRYDRKDREPEILQERPKIILQPRTLPLPELNFPKEEELERPSKKTSVNGDKENHNDSGLPEEEEKEVPAPKPKPKPVPSENIFGQAKPVDTAAREREIEEKLDQEREAKKALMQEEREKERLAAEAEKNDEVVDQKKEVINIRTESFRRNDEANNWRKHDEPSDEPIDNRNRDNGRRYGSPTRRQMGRNDERPRQFKDNRDRNYNRGNEFRSGGMNRGTDRREYPRRDGPPRRDTEIRREVRDDKEPVRRDRNQPKDLEDKMPKYHAPSGPDLQISNTFSDLDNEIDAECP